MAKPVVSRRWDVQRYIEDLLRRVAVLERRMRSLRFDPPAVVATSSPSILNSDYTVYTPGESEPVLHRRGDIVEFTGALRTVTAGVNGAGTVTNVITIPPGFRPRGPYSRVYVAQASGTNRITWTIAASSSTAPGRVDIGRLGNSTATSPTNNWLPFSFTWVTEDPAP